MPISLQERDFQILEHVAQYRMTVSEAVKRQPYFDGETPHAAENVIRRLCGSGYLKKERLYQRRPYYHLTLRGARTIEQPEHLAAPLNVGPKATAFAILSFCCLGERQREKLTPSEFKEDYPQLVRNGQAVNYYLDEEGPNVRLGYIRVDRGGYGRWNRVLQRCGRDIASRWKKEGFRRLINNGEFVIAIVTARPEKAEAIRRSVSDKEEREKANLANLPRNLEIKVEAFPDLLPLFVATAQGKSNRNA